MRRVCAAGIDSSNLTSVGVGNIVVWLIYCVLIYCYQIMVLMLLMLGFNWDSPERAKDLYGEHVHVQKIWVL